MNNIIFSKKKRRIEVLSELLLWPLSWVLHGLSSKYLLEKRNQLVIFSFDHIGHRINLDGVYEKEELEFLFDWLAELGCDLKNKTALDVGANIGNHSLFFSDRFKSVFSFEPNPRTFKVLSLNADLKENINCLKLMGRLDAAAAGYGR